MRICVAHETIYRYDTPSSGVIQTLDARAGVTLALPRLGITANIVPSLHMHGGGAWVDTPHEAVASAVLYFAALALFKWFYVAIRKANPHNNRAPPIWPRTH